MTLTCSQMDVLISFYIEGDLSSALKNQVEEHMKDCATCRAKFEIIKSMIKDLKMSLDLNETTLETPKNDNYNTKVTSQQYSMFVNNLSPYLDNELNNDENIKIKKFTINNLKARKDLEENYAIRKIMNESFKKTETELRHDFSKNILKQLELDDDINFGIHPAIKILVFFTITVLIATSIVLSIITI